MELRICVPTKLPDDADTASPQTTLSIKGLTDIDPSPPQISSLFCEQHIFCIRKRHITYA